MTPTRALWALAGVLLLAVAVVAWVKVGPTLNPDVLAVAISDSGCDLRAGPCKAMFADGASVTFEVSPRHIPVVEPLLLAVRVEGLDPSAVEVDFAGVAMNMGFNRVRLDPAVDGSFSGNGMLPVCVRARMTWEARVLLQTDKGLVAAPFRFDTFRPGAGLTDVTEPGVE